MDTVLIYARVSTEDQLEKYGLPSQLRACREYAVARGWQILEEITDDGISGVILERPGLDRVRRLVREGGVSSVLMFDTDRLSRELAHLLILKPEIEKHARLEFVAARFEDSPSGRLFFGIRGVIAQYEREQMRERTMRGKKERARSGLIVGGRCAFGYGYEGGRLAPDAERAPVVVRMFAAYDRGLSLRAVAEELRASGAPTYGGGKWGRSSVRRVLSNETYAGVAYYGTHRREGKRLHLRASGERILIAVPALVTRELFDRVQARLASNAWVGRPSTHLLRGLLFCQSCGRRMCGERGRTNAYRCTGRDALRLTGSPCRNHAPLAGADRVAWSAIVETCTDAPLLRSFFTARQREIEQVDPGRAVALRTQLVKWKAREDAALNAMLDPELSAGRAVIKERYREASRERKRIDVELAAIAPREVSSDGGWIEPAVALMRQYLPQVATPKERQEIARRFLNRVEWDGENLHVSFCLAPQNWSQHADDRNNLVPFVFFVSRRLAA